MSGIFKPIVFINNPILDSKDDLIGISYQAKLITEAINKESRMIAITGEYGAGKTSLVNLIGKDIKCIPVSLYHSFEKNLTNEEEIKNYNINLFKSFNNSLLNNINNKSFREYAIKKMNKSYGSIEFGINICIESYIPLLFSVFILVLPIISHNLYLYGFIESSNLLLNIPRFIYPFSNYISLGFLFIFLAMNNFLFSLWDSQGKRDVTIEDIILLNIEIVDRIISESKKNEKLIISIEDLDRINSRKEIYNFLKLIYRINELYKTRIKNKKVVFIVSIKDEKYLGNFQKEIISLESVDSNLELMDDKLFSKLFDYIIEIKPIHIQDFKNITLKLLKSVESDLKEIDIFKDLNIFPEQIQWLIQGENISIREVKERLNSFFELYYFLKNRDNSGYINIEACAIIIYLERKYPIEFYQFVNNNIESSRIFNSIYKMRLISNNLASFQSELEYFMSNRIFGQNPRMYFYRFPKGEYITSINEEKLISNISNTENIDGNLDELINLVLNKDDGTRTISNFLNKYFENKTHFPISIFYSYKLIEIAYKINSEHLLNSLVENFTITDQNISESANFQKVIEQFYKLNKDKILVDYYKFQFSKNELIRKGITNELLITYRANIIEWIEKTSELKNFFYSNQFPAISKQEIKTANSINFFIDTFNKSRIMNEEIINSYLDYLTSTDINNVEIVQIENIVFDMLQTVDHFDFNKFVEFMFKHKLSNSKLLSFADINNNLNQENVRKYVQLILGINIKKIDNLVIKNLSKYDLSTFKINNLFASKLLEFGYLSSFLETLILNESNFSLLDPIKDNIIIIQNFINNYPENSTVLLNFRKIILTHNRQIISIFKRLFMNPFPVISELELNNLSSYEVFSEIFDFNDLDYKKVRILEKFLKIRILNSAQINDLLKNSIDYINTAKSNKNVSIEILNILKSIDILKSNLPMHVINNFFDICYEINESKTFLERLKIMEEYKKMDLRQFVNIDQTSIEINKRIIRIIELEGISVRTSQISKKFYLDHQFELQITQRLHETGDETNYLTSLILRNVENINKLKIDADLLSRIFMNTVKCRKKLLEDFYLMKKIINQVGFNNLNDKEKVDYFLRFKDNSLISYISSNFNRKAFNNMIIDILENLDIDESNNLIIFIFNNFEILKKLDIEKVKLILSFCTLEDGLIKSFTENFIKANKLSVYF